MKSWQQIEFNRFIHFVFLFSNISDVYVLFKIKLYTKLVLVLIQPEINDLVKCHLFAISSLNFDMNVLLLLYNARFILNTKGLQWLISKNRMLLSHCFYHSCTYRLYYLLVWGFHLETLCFKSTYQKKLLLCDRKTICFDELNCFNFCVGRQWKIFINNTDS